MDVSLVGPNLSGRISTSTYVAGSPALLFRKMAAKWRGWDGEIKWSTLEEDFSLTATADRTGHVDLLIKMQNNYYPYGWEMQVHFALEAGSLEDLFKKTSAIFPIHPNAPAD
jgi:hypothetical protein